MNRAPFSRILIATLVLIVVFAPSCAMVEGALGSTDLISTVKQVGSLATQASDWASTITDYVPNSTLETMGDFAGQFSGLLGNLTDITGVGGTGQESAASESNGLLDGIMDTLGGLSSFRSDEMLPLGQPERVEEVQRFSGLTNNLASQAQSFLLGS